MNNQNLGIIRIDSIHASQDTELEFRGLDLAGVGVLGEIIAEISGEHRSTAFAITASLFGTQRPVYYSYPLNAVSTDASFGATPSRPVNFARTGALRVMNIDGIWSFSTGSGTLVLTLEDGPIAHVDVNDPNALIGWLHVVKIATVTFDGTTIATALPRLWPQDAFSSADTDTNGSMQDELELVKETT